MNKKGIIVSAVTLMLAIIALIFNINYTEEDVNKISEGIETISNIVDSASTTEIPNLSETDEQTLEVQESNLENDAFEEKSDIAYNGSDKTPKVEVGEYQGLTYYSQADSRWANHKYSVIGDKSQTIESSGCGPTCAAMIVSSIRGTITPPEMGDLFVKYGYRSANNGTYWSAFKWTADVFDIGYKETYSLNTAIDLLKDNYYVVAICNEGLFTYGGHFIVLTGVTDDTIRVYDPYLYSGKFDVSSRKGKATVKGNTVYVTKNNFNKHANAKKFYCFKNDRAYTKENTTTVTTNENTTSNVKSVNYKVKVTANSGLNIRTGASTSYKRVGGYIKGTTVTITKESNGWGKTKDGWICLNYTKKVTVSKAKTYTVSHKKGLNIRSGRGTKYRIKGAYTYKTKVKVTDIKNNWRKNKQGICVYVVS